MIPKILGHIWIGPYLPPEQWMKTWPEKHPNWEYKIYDNEYLANRRWRLQQYIDEYMKRGVYAGVADIMRYEILLEAGGFIAPADSICLHAVDDLFVENKAYTVFENEMIRGNLMMPFLASPKNNKAVSDAISLIEKQIPSKMGHAYLSTGNYITAKVTRKNPNEVIVLPSYTFYPNHVQGIQYEGEGKIYSEQFSGSYINAYKLPKGGLFQRVKWHFEKKSRKRRNRKANNQAEYLPYDDDDINFRSLTSWSMNTNRK